jgi:non-specific serine/threonine protein kinase/serine/threonine-protein kinase
MPRSNAAEFIVQRYCKLIEYRLISRAEPFEELGYSRIHSTKILFFFVHRLHHKSHYSNVQHLRGSAINQLVRHLFEELVALTRGEREMIFVERRVAPEIRTEVESLLFFDKTAGHRLTGCVAGAAEEILASAGVREQEIGNEPAGEVHPSRIGQYRILAKLGAGGMGVVYQAEQGHPRRIVALKVIRPGLTSPELIQRFERESEALGRLQHPGIARIYEAGAADADFGAQPYYAMEFIQGQSLGKYVEGHQLHTRGRLEIMAKICEAVHHAHQRGLIHRDLKPGNILVDETGQPKILDFGVARMTDSDTHTTCQTDLGQLVGTLAYMSPEQVLANPLELDTRSDVYALGVILYELLAGRLPYTLSRKVHEAVQTIRETDPAPLSTVSNSYRGDIETIVAKALEKGKERRYSSAADLAADIRRYLDDEPITARPPSAAYQLQKFARRNRVLVAGIAAVFMVLAGGIVASTWQAVRANRAGQIALAERDRAFEAEAKARAAEQAIAKERDRAVGAEQSATQERNRAVVAETQAIRERNRTVTEKRRADGEAATAKAVSDFLQGDLLAQASANTQARPDTKPDPDLKVRTALDRAAARIPGKFEKHPLVEAAIRKTIANTYKDLGLYAEAQRQLERAIELLTRVQGEQHPDTLHTMNDLAELYIYQSKFAAARSLHSRVLEIRRRVLGEENISTLTSIHNLGVVYEKQGKYALAEPLQARFLEAARRLLGEEDLDTLHGMTNLALTYVRQGKYAQAEALDTEAVEIMRRVLGEEHPDTLTGMNNLAQVYYREGKYAPAEDFQAAVLAIRRRVLGEEHPDTLMGMNNLALILYGEGKYAEAEATESSSVEIMCRVLGEEHPNTLTHMGNLARMYSVEGKYAQAEALSVKVLEIRRRVSGEEHPDTLHSMYGLAQLYRQQARYGEAEPLYTKILEGCRRVLGPQHPDTTDVMVSLGELRLKQGRYNEAEPLLAEAEKTLEQVNPANWKRYYPKTVLGAALAGEKRYGEAEPLLLSGYTGLIQRKATIPAASKSHLAEAGDWIVQLYRDWGQPDKVTEWQSKLANENIDVIAIGRK